MSSTSMKIEQANVYEGRAAQCTEIAQWMDFEHMPVLANIMRDIGASLYFDARKIRDEANGLKFHPLMSPERVEAARRYLNPEAAERYIAGDMFVTDEDGILAIDRIAKEIAEEAYKPKGTPTLERRMT